MALPTRGEHGRDMKERLKAMQKAWEARGSSSATVPDGKYEMKLQDFSIDTAKSSGKLMITREHLITSGEFAGDVVRDRMSLETEYSSFFVSQWIESMGCDPPEQIEDLPETIQSIVEDCLSYTATVKKSGDFVNVTNCQLIESYDDDDDEEEDRQEQMPKSKASKGAMKKAPASKDSNLRESLLDFAESQGVENLDPSCDLDEIRDLLNEYVWESQNLTDEECALLVEADIDVDVVESKPKTKAKAKTKSTR